MQKAGAVPVHHPSEFGSKLAFLLDPNGEVFPKLGSRAASKSHPSAAGSVRSDGLQSSLFTAKKSQSRSFFSLGRLQQQQQQQQIRKLHLDSKSSIRLWEEEGLDRTVWHRLEKPSNYLALTIDRATRDVCVLTCSDWDPDMPHDRFNRIKLPVGQFPVLDLGNRINSDLVNKVLAASDWKDMTDGLPQIKRMLEQMAHLFTKYEAKSVSLQFLPPSPSPRADTTDKNDLPQPSDLRLEVFNLSIDLDEAAYRGGPSRARFPPQQYATYESLRSATTSTIPDQANREEAERHGLVYYRMSPSERDRTVGIVVNGAGLAMNTMDELRRNGIPAANFLDTGGLATSETVAKAMEIVLRDERVRVLFVNVFGGLTRGGMIAKGILGAMDDNCVRVDGDNDNNDGIPVPIVVRIQGTGDEEGRSFLREEGVKHFSHGKLFVYGDFDRALTKVDTVVNADV